MRRISLSTQASLVATRTCVELVQTLEGGQGARQVAARVVVNRHQAHLRASGASKANEVRGDGHMRWRRQVRAHTPCTLIRCSP